MSTRSCRRWASISVAGQREDGNYHIEVVARRVGTEWAIDWFRQRAMRRPMPGSISPVLHLSQYDDARAFTAHLKDESGNPFTLPSGATAKLEGMNCKGVTFEQTATVSGSDITFTPNEAATDQPGLIAATLHIKNSNDNISTLAVILNVQKNGATREEQARSPGFTDAIQAAVEAWAQQQGFSSPTVTITEITGGHRITFTDAQHPQGQSIDVMDGTSVTVDPTLTIEGAAADAKVTGDNFRKYIQHDSSIESTVLDVVSGKYVNPSTGVISNNQYWYSCEEFYPVTAGQIYSIGNNGKSLYANPYFIWYKADKSYISSEQARFSTAPSEAAFLRFTISISAASTEVYENGKFVLQNQKIPSEIKLDNLQNLRVSQTDDRLASDVLGAVNENVNIVDDSRYVTNLFDGLTIHSGYRVDSHGVGSAPKYTANASFWATDPIPVEPGKSYSFWNKTDYGYECNSNAGAAIFIYYNSALEQISNGSGVYKFTTPADCYFVIPTFVTAGLGNIILTDAADVDLPFGKPIIKNAYGLTSAYGKKWLLFGDSITEINFRAKAHYQDFIRKELGLTVVNEAVSGAGYHTRLNDNVAVYQKIGASTVTDPDLVTIMAGINDIAIENPAPDLGTVSDTTNATVMGCVYLAVQAAREKWPTVPLAILSPVPQSSTVPTANKNSRMEQFIALMTEFCRLNSIPFLDQYTGSPMRPWDRVWNTKYYSCASAPNGDGTHPNMYGHDLMHGKIREFIRTLL